MRALCDLVSEHIGGEYEQLAASPAHDRTRLLAEVQISESLQSKMQNACALKQQEGQSPQREMRIAGFDAWTQPAPPGSTRH
jgi:hypothetical protein